jgi:hypothetical protein
VKSDALVASPRDLPAVHAAEQAALLLVAGQRTRGVERPRVERASGEALVDLVVALLPGVEHVERRQVAVAQLAVELDLGAPRPP